MRRRDIIKGRRAGTRPRAQPDATPLPRRNPKPADWAPQYDLLVPQCLVIAPGHADLSTLEAVLAELGITATATTQLLAGAQLATVPLDEYNFAAAVLPAPRPGKTPAATPATIYLEAGRPPAEANSSSSPPGSSHACRRFAVLPGPDAAVGPRLSGELGCRAGRRAAHAAALPWNDNAR